MIKYNNTNNASTTLTAWISPSSTTLIVENGDILPTAPFLLTLEHFDNEKVTVREIVKCIAKAWNILTIQRGAWTCVQDDTATPKAQNNTPHSFSVWDCASIYWTSEQVQDIQNEIEKKLNIDDFQAWTYVYWATSTETDAYSITIPWTLTSYAVGQVFRFMADTENTWNATLNVNGIWEKEILKNHDQHLQSGDIEAGQIVEVAYDGTNFQMDSQIASVISLDDISSLSYNDTTCYAWEEIHENDLIVTNGNSFNPDRTDEDLSVWGTTVNKYAIWFTWNGKAWNLICKFSINEWFEPNSVTINVESDNNWKPSWTVLKTNTDITYLKNYINTSSCIKSDSTQTVCESYSGKFEFHSKDLNATFSNWVLTISNGVTMDFTWVEWWENVSLNQIMFDDQHFLFWWKFFIYTPTKFSTEWAYIVGWKYTWNRGITMASRDWTIVCWTVPNNNPPIYAKLTTPFDMSSYSNETQLTNNYVYAGGVYILDPGKWKILTVYLKRASYYKLCVREITISDMSLWNETEIEQSSSWYQIYGVHSIKRYGILTDVFFGAMWSSDKYYSLTCWLAFDKDPITRQIINSVSTTKWTKYRLTIAPVVTWSVVDSMKIYDKEWEYCSECAVNDTNNVWSNVANRTPYIEGNCILARYARKVNGNDNLENVPCGFANGDYSELEPVSYCFQWAKSGFSWLHPDTLYYSDWAWWITETAGTYSVWKSVNENTLLTNIKTA